MTIRTTTKAVLRAGVAALFAASLTGCLEVDQHPPYVDGHYDGKPDQLPEQVVFNGDTAKWAEAIGNRVMSQNEYNRTGRD